MIDGVHSIMDGRCKLQAVALVQTRHALFLMVRYELPRIKYRVEEASGSAAVDSVRQMPERTWLTDSENQKTLKQVGQHCESLLRVPLHAHLHQRNTQTVASFAGGKGACSYTTFAAGFAF